MFYGQIYNGPLQSSAAVATVFGSRRDLPGNDLPRVIYRVYIWWQWSLVDAFVAIIYCKENRDL